MSSESLVALKRISILIPTYNEEHYIAGCLDSILMNDYPQDFLEILVIDGGSTDFTREIVQRYIERYHFIRLLENPKRIQAEALNIGIREATGEIIICMSAHAVYAPDYIRQCVTLLQETGAANVGGLMSAVGQDYLSNGIAIALSSPFGIGDARYRYSDREEWVDTVFAGCWYKKTLEALGGFNEEWVVNEDYELNYRLRQMGGKILFSPKIRCQYFVRRSLRALARQFFRYGFWRVKTLVAYPDSLRWRQLVPPLFILMLIASLTMLPVFGLVSIVIPGLYIGVNVIASLQAARHRGWQYLPVLPLVFTTIHISWGLGFLFGLGCFGIPRLSWRSVMRAFRSPRCL